MRIALLHPTYWPEVLRGAERVVHDIAVRLARRGHEVTVVTSHPGRTEVAVEENVTVVRSRRPPETPLHRPYELFINNVPNAFRRSLRGGFDLVHAHFPTDAWAAVGARRLGGPPVVHTYHGIPSRQWLVDRRYRLELTRSAVEGAAANTVVSEAAASPFRQFLLADPLVLPSGVDTAGFATTGIARSERPLLVSASSFADPRKRGPLLLEAFSRLRERVPDARLELLRADDPLFGSERLPELPEGAEWVRAGHDAAAVAARYARAWATVMPAVNEALGLVTIESLAAGTPVVAARSGASPEIVAEGRHGWIFEPDDPDALAAALAAALEPGRADALAAACRKRAADWDWETLIGDYESLYERVAADPQGAGTAGPSA